MFEFIDKAFEESLDIILQNIKPKNILLFTGELSYENSPVKSYFDKIAQKIQITRYSGFGNNPHFDKLVKALQTIKNTQPDLIIAVGGGSVIDFSKLVKLYLGNLEMLITSFPNINTLNPNTPMVTLPTTSGSGSEATHFAVVYKDGEKFSVSHKNILSEFVIIDPVLTYTMTPYQTACSGMDALCQGIESLWAVGATMESRGYAKRALEFICPYILSAVKNPIPENRRAMSLGAYYAGKAINISKTTGPHALSYYLTEHYGVPHGEAVAMNMEVFIDLNFEFVDIEAQTIILNCLASSNKENLIDKFKCLKKELGLKKNILDVKITTPEAIMKFIESSNLNRLNNNPVKPTKDMLFSKYQQHLLA